MGTMNEAKGSLRGIEQKYKLFQQQQFTFIAALEHCRENAHDKIRPIASIEQVPSRAGRWVGLGPGLALAARTGFQHREGALGTAASAQGPPAHGVPAPPARKGVACSPEVPRRLWVDSGLTV